MQCFLMHKIMSQVISRHIAEIKEIKKSNRIVRCITSRKSSHIRLKNLFNPIHPGVCDEYTHF